MSRTITKHWPSSTPNGDKQAQCDYCGVVWRRSQLNRDEAGLLYCPDEGEGRDGVALSRANAEAASEMRGIEPDRTGGVPPTLITDSPDQTALDAVFGEGGFR